MNENNHLPKGWELVTFDDVCIKIGDIDHKMPKQVEVGGFPYVSTKDFTAEFKISFKNAKYISEEDYVALSRKIKPEKGDIIFPRYGTIGKNILVDFDKDFLVSYSCAVIKPNHNLVDSKYAYYFSLSPKTQDEIRKYTVETTQANIGIASIKIFVFPLPPLPEQHRIVAKIEELFSSLDKGIENLRTAQAQLKIYRQAVLKWAFEGKLTHKDVKEGELPEGWKWVEIGTVCKCIVPNRDKPKSFSGSIKWITTPNLSEISIRIDYSKATLGLSNDEIVKYNARVIPTGSVIMTCVGNFGIGAIVEKPIVINQQLHAFLPSDIVNPKFLTYCVQFNKDYFEKKSTSTTIKYLNKENCNSMPFPLIQLSKQHQIVQEIESRLSVCDKIEESITHSLRQAEALRQSILKKAFEGKLVPQDPNDEPAAVLLERIKAEREKEKPSRKSKK